MKFEFFTLGGSQFWEDVFFYQKWRIQRNYETKKCRLLDPWDIRRHEGTFESCRKAFFRYIETYELSRQKGPMIVMFHGLFDSKNIFKPLWREALKDDFEAAAVNYPSTQKHIESHVRQLDFFMEHLEDVKEVSFVTKGCGGLILRYMLKLNSPWQKRIKIKRIVQVNPPNQGSRLFGKLNNSRIARMIFGPMLGDCAPAKAMYVPEFSNKTEFGIINCDSWGSWLLKLLPKTLSQALYRPDEALLTGAKDTAEIKSFHLNPFKDETVVEKTMNFIKNGKF